MRRLRPRRSSATTVRSRRPTWRRPRWSRPGSTSTVDWTSPTGPETGSFALAPIDRAGTWQGTLTVPAGTLLTVTRIQVTATAQDAAGNTDTSDPITVTVFDCP